MLAFAIDSQQGVVALDTQPSKKELRRQARLERKTQEAEQRHRTRLRRNALIGTAVAAVVAVAGWQLWDAFGPAPASAPAGVASRPRPQVVEVPVQGAQHVLPGEPHPAYNSNPPTAGWHYGATAPWGFHNDSFPDELIIHNLEHGGIWITYKSADDAALIDQLVALARRYRSKVIVTLRPANDSRIAVAAWGRLMTLKEYDEAAIVDFINRFKNKGPEQVPD